MFVFQFTLLQYTKSQNLVAIVSLVAELLATSEFRKRPGKSEVDNASWDCFRGRKRRTRPQKQSRDALSTSLLPGLLRNSEVANRETV